MWRHQSWRWGMVREAGAWGYCWRLGCCVEHSLKWCGGVRVPSGSEKPSQDEGFRPVEEPDFFSLQGLTGKGAF